MLSTSSETAIVKPSAKRLKISVGRIGASPDYRLIDAPRKIGIVLISRMVRRIIVIP